MRDKGVRNRDFKGLRITYPASGFQNDVVKLIQKFVKTRSIRFEDFVRVWKATNFSLIYIGRSGIREKRELIEEVFKILLKYLMPPHNLQVRIGGLYLLYSIYYTQPLKNKRRIRIPLSCWQNFCELKKEIEDGGHLDTAYIIRKLLADRAFMICAYPSTLSVDEVYTAEDFTLSSQDSTSQSEFDISGGIFSHGYDDDNICQLDAVHNKYHQLKCKYNTLNGGSDDSPGPSLNLIRSDIVKTIVNIINPMVQPLEQSHTVNASDSDSSQTSDRAKRIKALKDEALSSKVSAVRSFRHKKTTVASVETPPQHMTESGFLMKMKGRPLPKAPTVKSPKPSKESSRKKSSDEDKAYDPKRDIDPRDTPVRQSKRRRSSISIPEQEDEEESGVVATVSSIPMADSTASQDKDGDVSANITIDSPVQIPTKKRYVRPRKIVVGTFVAMKPEDETSTDPIIIGEVVAYRSWVDMKVFLYQGNITGAWHPATNMNDDETEGKPIVRKISGEKILLSGFSLTKNKRLPMQIQTKLKKILDEEANA